MRQIVMVVIIVVTFTGAASKGNKNMPNAVDVPTYVKQALGDARRQALFALSENHRSRVEIVIDQVSKGRLEPQVAASQIDALLTASETAAVLAAGEKYSAALTSWMQSMPRRSTGTQRPTPDAGMMLIMLSTVMDSTEPDKSP